MKHSILKSAALISLIVLFVSLSGCTGGEEGPQIPSVEATPGDVVRVHYTGTLEDGTVFDTSEGKEPLEFTVGAGQMIEGFDAAVVGMHPGEEKTVTLTPEQAYGEYREDLVLQLDRDMVAGDGEPEVGDQMQLSTGDGNTVRVTVTAINDTAITVDANHPLAGETLVFTIEMVEVIPAS